MEDDKQPQDYDGSREVKVRTMESDLKALNETGETPSPQEPLSNQPLAGDTFTNSNVPEEPIFKPVEPPLPPEFNLPPMPPLKGEMEPAAKPERSGNNVLKTTIALILLAGVGALGYFYGYPLLVKTWTPAEPETNVAEETQVEQPVTQPEEIAAPPEPETAGKEETTLAQLDLTSLRQTLKQTSSSAAKGSLKEIALKSGENIMTFSGLLPLILPEFVSGDLTTYFEDSLTVFIYTDENGSWPGYVAKAKDDIELLQAKSTMAEIENSSNLKNIFLEDITTIQGFKDGKAGSPQIDTRYLVFAKPGAALNYGWLNRHLIISASYPGFQKALESLR